MQNSHKKKILQISPRHVALRYFQVEAVILYAQQFRHIKFQEYSIVALSPKGPNTAM